MRDLFSFWRRAIHTKKSCPPTRPRITSSGAGESPRMSNGAPSDAITTPHGSRPEKPKLSRMIEIAAMVAPVQSICSSGCAGTFFSARLSTRFTTANATTSTNDQRHPIVVANVPAMQEREHTGGRDGRREQADGDALLTALGSSSDEDGERRADEGDERHRMPPGR